MAVLGRVLFSSAERVDLPDLLSIDSYAAGDWKYFLQTFVGTSRPYILTGFDVISPETAVGTQSCTIQVADSVVYYPGSAAGPFFYGLPEGNANSTPLIPQLRTNTINYVYLTLSTFSTAADTRALWDPDRNGGAGAEFTQDIDTESVIQAQVNVSTGSFPVNTVPVAIIAVGADGKITSIQDSREMFFRLGSGGLSPNATNEYSFRNLPDATYARSEPDTTISSGSEPNPFQGGDKNIKTLKEWMDVVMTKLKELGGTRFWYENTGTFNLMNVFKDTLTGSWKSKGAYTHSGATPGQLSWSEDIHFKSAISPRDLVFRASGGSPLNLADEQVAFIKLIRNQPVNSLDTPVSFVEGEAYVNAVGGSTGSFANLRKGDWVKKATDHDILFLQVMEFYDAVNATGSVVVSAADARSIRLSGPYEGTSSQSSGDRARYDRGEYTSADIQVVDRSDSAIVEASGDNFWFALRSDTILTVSNLISITVSGTVSSADGALVTVSATNHGLVDGDRITVTAPAAQAGTYTVNQLDSNTFTFPSTDTTTGVFTGFYAIATTAARSTPYGYLLESASHGVDSGETVIISGTTNYNGSHVASVRSTTQLQFAVTQDWADETPASALLTVPRIDARAEEGVNRILQGTTVEVSGDSTVGNIRTYVGMTAPDQTIPVYSLPGGYNTLTGTANYNTLSSDNLTARISKLTAMVADKAQDKNVCFVTEATEATNTLNGAVRNLSFVPASSTLTIVQPGSPGNATITLPSVGAPLQLNTNQCAYVTINRNASSTPGITVANISAVPVDENVFVIAYRLSTEVVFLWNGQSVVSTAPLAVVDHPFAQITYHNPVSTTLPTGSGVTIDGTIVQANETVLFTNLSSGNNTVYKAVGVGNNITSWTAVHAFHDSTTPVIGDMVVVRRGVSFGQQIGRFNGTTWGFNDKVRYFNGADYVEQSNIVSTTIANNTTATIITTSWIGNEHMIVDYSIVRSTSRETGTMRIVTDGATASVATDSSYVNGSTGVGFSARISGTDLIVEYTSSNNGQTGTMKYMVRRWASGPGGPNGVPSYAAAAPAPTAAGGSVNTIQFNSGGAVTGNANFAIDTIDLSMNLNGLRQGVLSSAITVLDNQTSWTNLFSMPDTNPFVVIEYSVSKEGFARVGRLLIACDATTVSSDNTYVETGATGFQIQAIKSGSNIQVQYQTTDGAGNGTFKYSWRKWA